MTHPALTAEQRAAYNAELLYHANSAVFHESQSRKHRSRVMEIEQLLADLDSKQVTPRQLRCLKGCKEVDDECDAAGHPIVEVGK